MSLPSSTPSTGKVELSGGTVEYRALTMIEGRKCRDARDEAEADALCISFATGVPLDEVKVWIETCSARDFRALIDAIMEDSSLSAAAKFPAG